MRAWFIERPADKGSLMEWLYSQLSGLTDGVNLGNPAALGVLFSLGIVGDIGVPLLLTVEVFLFFTSYSIGPLSTQVLLIVLMLLLGREVGAAVLYWVSRSLGSPLINRVGKRFPWLPNRIKWVETRLNKQPALSVAVVRLTPGLLQIPSLAAGVMRLRYFDFALGVALSSLAYDVVIILFGLGARFGLENVKTNPTAYLLAGFIIFSSIVWLALYFASRRNLRQ
jgi:membrane protein DedA with SNARE-associated domain